MLDGVLQFTPGSLRAGCSAAAFLICSCGNGSESAPPADPPVPERPLPAPFEPPACAATATTEGCVDDPTFALCPGAAGYEFLQASIGIGLVEQSASSFEGSSASLSVPEPGKFCVSAVMPTPPANDRSELDLLFFLSRRDRTLTCILSPFDARGLDIRAVQFDLDRVPAAWFAVGVSVIQQAQCVDDLFECSKGGLYDWVTPDHQEIVALHPGTIRVPFDELSGDDLPGYVDEHWISEFGFYVIAGSGPLAVEFCVSNIKLLDSAGQEVIPPPFE